MTAPGCTKVRGPQTKPPPLHQPEAEQWEWGVGGGVRVWDSHPSVPGKVSSKASGTTTSVCGHSSPERWVASP